MPTIRPSQLADIPAITAIYAHHVLHGTGTFEVDPPTQDDMTSRRADVLSKRLPYLVATEGDKLLGFAYCNWFKPRPAYRFSAEDSIYMAQAELAGVRKLIPVIGDSANVGSVAVHRSVGFSHIGTLKSCGWKFDRWLDVVMMDKSLGLDDSNPPQ